MKEEGRPTLKFVACSNGQYDNWPDTQFGPQEGDLHAGKYLGISVSIVAQQVKNLT